jgi:hypothetical protein
LEGGDERRRRAYDMIACRLNPIEHARRVVVTECEQRSPNERPLDAFDDHLRRRIVHDSAALERFEQIDEPPSSLVGPGYRCDELGTSSCLEAGKIRGLRRRTLPQRHVEQNFDSDVRDGTSGTLCYAE